jgi:bacillithiol synthase
MQVHKISLQQSRSFSGFLTDYLAEKPSLKPFYAFSPNKEGILNAVSAYKFPESRRLVLKNSLLNQYQGFTCSEALSANINRIAQANTFTITTGHQLNIFTGPLYFIYKIVSVINACKELNRTQSDFHFVPVYWMASEDHDLEEINHFQLFGKKYQWETSQTGPVGLMHTHGLVELAKNLPEAVPLFEDAYAKANNLAEATRIFVNALFGEEGLVILDGNDSALKASFKAVMKDDLQHHKANELVELQSALLEKEGYKAQVFPRQINLFYMEKGLRERIVKEGNQYAVLNTDLKFSESEILNLLDEHPERCSPNVILRPLYQQFIMPNAAYLGGPAEVAYWMQLMPVFEQYKISFPVIIPRNFALWIGKGTARKMEQLGLSVSDVFLDYTQLKQNYLDQQGFEAPDISEQENKVKEAYEAIVKIALEFDGSLKGFIEAEESRALKSLENIGKRLTKAAESRMETSLRQIESIKEKLFPGGTAQERVDNYLNIAFNNPNFIGNLFEHFDAFDYQYYVFVEND